jgi:glycine/D-amino acid oxidase-like deaminating enzyme
VSRRGPDAVVIGGGIVGAAAAAFLAGAGARVTLVEREGLASGASGANSGAVQHPIDPILADLYHETIALYRALSASDAGFRLPDEPAGLLYLSADERAVRRIESALQAGLPELVPEVVTGSALGHLEPAIAPALWACRVRTGYPVQPGASTYAYATLAERSDVVVRLGRGATLDIRGDALVGVIVDGRRIACDTALVAAGPWTPGIVDPSGRWTPIRESWGVVVETDLPNGPHHVVEEAGIGAAIGAEIGGQTAGAPADALPRPAPTDRERSEDQRTDVSLVPLAGVATVGSTFLEQEPHPDAWIERILTRAAAFVPGVAEAPIRGVRACARPLSADGRPLIGRVPGRRGLWVCAGHGPWGISTGPASARRVADAILGRAPAIPRELDPARFGSPSP